MKFRSAWFALVLAANNISLAHAIVATKSERLLKKEAEILRRVVHLSGRYDCTGVWMESGILLTSEHCGAILSRPDRVEVNGIQTRIRATVDFQNPNAPKITSFKQYFASFEPKSHPRDLSVWWVDAEPLASLQLPSEPLSLAPISEAKTSTGTELLIAGYGPSDAETEAGTFSLGAAHVAADDSDFHGKFWDEIGQFRLKTSATIGMNIHLVCRKERMLQKCTYHNGFFSDRRNSGAAPVLGDSGGPAFVQGSDGRWVLKGILSGTLSTPVDVRRVQTTVTFEDGRKRFFNLAGQPGLRLGERSTAQVIAERNLEAIDRAGIDSKRPFTESFEVTQKLRGEIRAGYVDLSDPEIQSSYLKIIADLRKQASESKSAVEQH